MSDPDSAPPDTMVQRAGGRVSRARLWVLIDASRVAIAATLTAGTFAILVGLRLVGGSPFPNADGSSTTPLFQALIISLVTGVTVIVAIILLVISQELDPVGDLRDQIADSMSFRRETEDVLGTTSPPEPASFLRALVETSARRAATLEEAASDSEDEAFRNDVTALVDRIIANSDSVSDRLATAEFGTFEVVRTTLDYNYSRKIYRARRLREKHVDSIDDESDRALRELIDVLTLFGSAREHFKTLYFQWDLVNLSRRMLYCSVPPLIGAISLLLYPVPEIAGGAALGVEYATWIVSIVASIAVFPFFLLVSYVMRIGTVAMRTLAIGPFILRASEEGGDGEVDG